MTFWPDHRGNIHGVGTIRVYELIQDLPYIKYTIVWAIFRIKTSFSIF